MAGKYRDTEVYFEHSDYTEEWNSDCGIYILSWRTAAIAVAAIRYAEYINTRWFIDGNSIPPDSPIRDEISIWVSNAYRELTMSCDLQDFNNNIDRIATALESIDAKTAERYTWADFEADMLEAFGIGDLLYQLITSFLGLMPRLQLKADMTWAAAWMMEYLFWRLPIKKLLFGLNASLGIIAGSVVTTKILSIIDLFIKGLQLMQGAAIGWKDFIFGDKNMWDDLLLPLFFGFMSTEDGGLGGDNPDADPTNRVSTLISIQNIINACCVGIPNLPVPAVPAAYVPDIDQSGSVGEEQTPVNTSGITWGSANSGSVRCQTARYIIQGIQEWITGLINQIPDTDVPFAALMSSIVLVIVAAAIPVAIPVVALIGIASILAGVSVGQAVRTFLEQISSEIAANEQDILCALYTGPTVQAVQDNIASILSVNLTDPQVSLVRYLFNYTSLASLFYENPGYDESGFSDDCSECGCQDFSMIEGTRMGNTFSSIFSSGLWRISLATNSNDGGFTSCGSTVTVNFSNSVNFTPTTTQTSVGTRNGIAATTHLRPITGFDAYNSNTIPGQITDVRTLWLTSTTQFTIDITAS